MKICIVIPARYGSKRFPGKPLAKLAGKTILQRVWDIAQIVCSQRLGCEAIVATETQKSIGQGSGEIINYCKEHNIPVVETSDQCLTGSDRVWETVSRMITPPDIVINLQGDNPTCPPDFLIKLIDTLVEDPDAMVATPCVRLSWNALDELRNSKKINPFSGTCCIKGKDGYAKWFSKNIIPALRNEEQMRNSSLSPILRHIGLYAYRFSALDFFSNAPCSEYEKMEQLEQLRFLENGFPIKLVEVNYPAGYEKINSGIDTLEDLQRAADVIAEVGELI